MDKGMLLANFKGSVELGIMVFSSANMTDP